MSGVKLFDHPLKSYSHGTPDKESSKKSVSDGYTIEQAIEYYGFGCFQIRIVCISGILLAADAMELLLLSVLGPALRCSWNLSSTEVALITTIVFIGYFVGAPLWGMFSDKFGRKTCLSCVLLLISYFGVLTALSPNFIWLLILRGLVGFGIGGGSSSYALVAEYLPIRYRATVLLAIQIFWAIGSSVEIGLSYLILPRFGWRWLVFGSAIPLMLFLVLLSVLPESARYLMAANRQAEAVNVMKTMASLNRKPEMDGELVASEISSASLGNFVHLYSAGYRCVSALLPILWFGATFTYYGAVLLSSEIFGFHTECFGEKSVAAHPHGNLTGSVVAPSIYVDTSCCQSLSNDDYLSMLISSFGEFAILPVNMLMVDLIGRRFSLAFVYFVLAIFFMLVNVCVKKIGMIAFLFILRAFSSGALNLIFLYTTEVYPTTIRSLGLGIFSSISRLGAMSTPYVAQVLLPDFSIMAGLSIYSGVCAVCFICACCLPIETKGRSMPHAIGSEIEVTPGSSDNEVNSKAGR